jgi:hypothetical protein
MVLLAKMVVKWIFPQCNATGALHCHIKNSHSVSRLSRFIFALPLTSKDGFCLQIFYFQAWCCFPPRNEAGN